MQIDPTQLSRITPGAISRPEAAAVEATAAPGVEGAAAPAQADRIVLSQQASEIQAAHEALAQAPEVRAELVEKLKAEVATGAYQVNAGNVAEKMLGE